MDHGQWLMVFNARGACDVDRASQREVCMTRTEPARGARDLDSTFLCALLWSPWLWLWF